MMKNMKLFLSNIKLFILPSLAYFNKPEYCLFEDGLCGWKNSGDQYWVWAPRSTGHFRPIYSSFSKYLTIIDFLFTKRNHSTNI